VKRLILNADDFGLTEGVNRAIAEAHRSGALTSATLMAASAATQCAVELASRHPGLGIGCHIVLVDGSPVLPAAQLPTLTGPPSGLFRATLGAFVKDLALGNILESEIQAEAEAQIARLLGFGVALTHIDTHKHTHMFPRVLRPVLRAARAAGIRAVRNPFEPQWSLRATPQAPLLRRFQVRLLRTLQPAFRRIVAEEGLSTTDGAIGVLATGTLDPPTLAALLQAMPDGDWELVTHPGYNDATLAKAGTRLLASREIELRALQQICIPKDLHLIHFGQLGNS